MQVFKLKKFDLDDVKRLIEIAKENDLAMLEIESKKGRRIRIETNASGRQQVTYAPGPQVQPVTMPAYVPPLPPVQPVAQTAEHAPTQDKPSAKAEAASKPSKTINAPMVGVFYKAPAPDAEPYVKPGQHISKGDVICIIEAMKLMNEIKAEEDGVIADILVKDGEIVEFGKPMFALK